MNSVEDRAWVRIVIAVEMTSTITRPVHHVEIARLLPPLFSVVVDRPSHLAQKRKTEEGTKKETNRRNPVEGESKREMSALETKRRKRRRTSRFLTVCTD